MAAAALQQGDTPIVRSWSDLPLDLAAAVLRRLPPRPLDRVRFGAVCPQWRAAARENPAMPPHFPWLALPDRTFYSLPDTAFRPLPVHLDGHRQLPHAQTSCGEWLVFERQDDNITLMSPFSAATMVLPGLHTLNPRRDDETFKIAYDVQGPAIMKLVVCSDNLVAAAVVDEPKVKLALCRPGAASWSWALVGGASVVVRDIVLYQGQLYAFSGDRRLSAVSITDDDGEPAVSSVHRVIGRIRDLSPFNPCYLLESGGELLMITKYNGTSGGIQSLAAAKFAVYVASFELSRWTMAQGDILDAVSDGRVLFLGPWCYRSVAVGGPDQRGSLGGNSVVFFSYEFFAINSFVRKRLLFYCAVFNLKTRRSLSCRCRCSRSKASARRGCSLRARHDFTSAPRHYFRCYLD